jgi:hypothetical protein
MTGASLMLLGGGTAAFAAPPPVGSYNTAFNGSGVLSQPGSYTSTGVAVVPAGDANAGNIVFTGTSNGAAPNPPSTLYDYTPSGASQWAAKSLSNFVALATAVVPSGPADAGDIVVAGWTNSTTACPSVSSPHHAAAVEMFTPAGAATAAGIVAIDCAESGQFNSVAVDAAGLPVAAGAVGGVTTLVARFTTALAPDSAFGTPSTVGWVETEGPSSGSNAFGVAVSGSGSGELIYTTGQAVFGGGGLDLAAAAFDHTGVLVPSFGNQGMVDYGSVGTGYAVAVLANNNIAVAGTVFPSPTATGTVNVIVQWTPTGTLTNFAGSGSFINTPNLSSSGSVWKGMAYEPTGNFLTVVGYAGPAQHEEMVVAQVNAGSTTYGATLNPAFNGNGFVTRSLSTGSELLNSVAMAPSGAAVAVGFTPSVGNGGGAATVIDLNGPDLTITPVTPVVKVTTNSPITLTYNVALDEQLKTPWTVTVCAGANPSASVNVNSSGSSCNAKTISTIGATTTTISVLSAVVTGYGHGENVTATVQPVNGLGTTASSGTATSQIQHYRPVPYPGYYFVASDGGIFNYDIPFRGSAFGYSPSSPIVGMAMAPSQAGYWVASANGGVFSFGVPFRGSAYNYSPSSPIVGMASDATGNGYWLVSRNGGLFTFGDAVFHGSAYPYHVNNIVGMAATPDGGGYWLLGSDGGVYTFGDAGFYGSAYGTTSSPFVSIASYPGAGGYWLLNRNGGVYTFGAAPYYGGLFGYKLVQPPVGIFGTATGNGYWIVLADGGIANEGGAPFYGSIGGKALNKPVVGIQ